MNALTLRILSAEGTLLEDTAELVSLQASDGSFGIMKGHVPAIASLQAGPVRYKKDGKEYTFEISGGIAEVRDNQVTIIAG